MKYLIAASTALATLTGCVTVQPIALQDRASQSYDVPVQKLVVDNLSTEVKISANDVIYVNGWAPAHSGFQPPLNQAFVSKVNNSIKTNGTSGRVDVSVLRVGFFVEKNVADDVVFIGLLTVGRDRGFKCDSDVNIKTDAKSRRITLNHEIKRPYFDSPEQTRQFIESCQSDLIRQLADEIKNIL